MTCDLYLESLQNQTQSICIRVQISFGPEPHHESSFTQLNLTNSKSYDTYSVVGAAQKQAGLHNWDSERFARVVFLTFFLDGT